MLALLTDRDKRTLQGGIFLFIIFFAGITYYYLMMLRPEIKERKMKIEELKKDIQELKDEFEEMKQMIAQEDEVNRQLEKVKQMVSRLPSSADAPGFLNELVEVLRITGAQNHKVIPQKTTPRYLYTEIPYKVTLTSRYHEFGQFLNIIEWNPRRFMRVKGLSIKNSEKRPSIHPTEVDIATFMFRE